MMNRIKVHDKYFVPFISAQQIEEKVTALAFELNTNYEDKNPLFISVLNGSFMFTSDLFKKLSIDAEVCFTKLSSYKGVQSSGDVLTLVGLDKTLLNRHVIILEDIVDSGKTMSVLMPKIVQQQPASVKLAALLIKPNALKENIYIDYNCFTIPDNFVVGYGLDYDGLGRNLPEIYQLQ